MALTVRPPFGTLTAVQLASLRAIAGSGPAPVVVTPWRTLAMVDLAPGAAHTELLVDLVADEESGWQGVSACTGSPGCSRAETDVRALTAAAVERHPHRPALPIHVVACPRRCGAPAGRHLDVLVQHGVVEATLDGRVRTAVDLDQLFDDHPTPSGAGT